MKKSLLAIIAATLLSAPLATGALAMTDAPMLKQHVQNRIAAIGFTPDTVEGLTISQLSLIKAIVASDDYSRNEKVHQIKAVLRRGTAG